MFYENITKKSAGLIQIQMRKMQKQIRNDWEDKLENDWKFDDRKDKEKLRAEGNFPLNILDNFDCPVCGCKRYVMEEDMHRIAVMDDGTEIIEYWSNTLGWVYANYSLDSLFYIFF